ncbi:MAG: hypothetical protein AABZ57_02720 [Candidatus Margulisiibacteriota bacterium]
MRYWIFVFMALLAVGCGERSEIDVAERDQKRREEFQKKEEELQQRKMLLAKQQEEMEKEEIRKREAKEELQKIKNSFSQADIDEIRELDRRIKVSEALIDQHLSPSVVFDALDEPPVVTLDNPHMSHFQQPQPHGHRAIFIAIMKISTKIIATCIVDMLFFERSALLTLLYFG